jgi:hypothetical protein
MPRASANRISIVRDVLVQSGATHLIVSQGNADILIRVVLVGSNDRGAVRSPRFPAI